jgi:hypothetical protein
VLRTGAIACDVVAHVLAPHFSRGLPFCAARFNEIVAQLALDPKPQSGVPTSALAGAVTSIGSRTPSRIGKKSVAAHFDPAVSKQSPADAERSMLYSTQAGKLANARRMGDAGIYDFVQGARDAPAWKLTQAAAAAAIIAAALRC